jgi:hypothetical protein
MAAHLNAAERGGGRRDDDPPNAGLFDAVCAMRPRPTESLRGAKRGVQRLVQRAGQR